MMAINHYLVGVSTAVILKNPVLAAPIAFMSHFVLDSLPHFSIDHSSKNRGKATLTVASLDALLLGIAAIVTLQQFPAWYLLVGLIAVSPDVAWVYRFIIKEKFGKLPPPPSSKFNEWHAKIQKFESKKGLLVEILVLVALGLWLFN